MDEIRILQFWEKFSQIKLDNRSLQLFRVIEMSLEVHQFFKIVDKRDIVYHYQVQQ